MRSKFEITMNEIKRNYDNSVIVESLPIHYEYVSQYRRIIVLFDRSAYEIRITYKEDAKEFNRDFSIRWKEKKDAIVWAEYYSENREIYFGCLTVIEKKGIRKT